MLLLTVFPISRQISRIFGGRDIDYFSDATHIDIPPSATFFITVQSVGSLELPRRSF